MSKITRKLFSVIFSLLLVFNTVRGTVFADENEAVETAESTTTTETIIQTNDGAQTSLPEAEVKMEKESAEENITKVESIENVEIVKKEIVEKKLEIQPEKNLETLPEAEEKDTLIETQPEAEMEMIEDEEAEEQVIEQPEKKAVEISFNAGANGKLVMTDGSIVVTYVQSVTDSSELKSVQAKADEGFEFVCWQRNGEKVSEKALLEATTINASESAVYTALFAAVVVKAVNTVPEKDELTVHITNIIGTTSFMVNGQAVTGEKTIKMVKNQGKLTTGLNSFVGGTAMINTGTSGFGYKYKFLNGYVLATGSPVIATALDTSKQIRKISYKGAGVVVLDYTDGHSVTLEGTYDLYISPVYSAKADWHLNYRYIDNISTGSGSWSNLGGVESYSHTFKNPDPAAHYTFVEWKDMETGKSYHAGDVFKYPGVSTPAPGSTTDITIYAMWQPSVTVNYYDATGTELLHSEEKFSDIALYGYQPAEIEGAEFKGWSLNTAADDGQILDSSTVFAAPEVTFEKNERTVYNVYGQWTTSYEVQYWTEGLEEGYELNESEIINDALIGTEAEAEIREYTGFSYDENAEEGLSKAIVKTGLVLKMFYSRNRYTVTWVNYNGQVLEQDENVAYGTMPSYDGATPARAADRSYTYRFLRWSPVVSEVTGDVTYTAEFTATTIPVQPSGNGTKTPDPKPTVEPEPDPIPEPEPQPMPEPEPLPEPEPILDPTVPLASAGSWALINLLAAIATVIAALCMAVTFFRKKEEEEDNAEEQMAAEMLTIESDEENDSEKNSRRHGKLLGIIPALVSVILFILTEDMTQMMVMADEWTLAMLVIMLVNFILAFFTRNRDDEEQQRQDTQPVTA
ncbi:MAG: hypothetical protein IJI05_04005 [Erysipelotrichaceae bacterium]|nr:hypothetical protein [Erysipelotrichaceae bacterium]